MGGPGAADAKDEGVTYVCPDGGTWAGRRFPRSAWKTKGPPRGRPFTRLLLFERCGELGPRAGGETQRPAVAVGGVADQDRAVCAGRLYAVGRRCRLARLAPRSAHGLHSSATFMISSRLSGPESASKRTRSKIARPALIAGSLVGGHVLDGIHQHHVGVVQAGDRERADVARVGPPAAGRPECRCACAGPAPPGAVSCLYRISSEPTRRWSTASSMTASSLTGAGPRSIVCCWRSIRAATRPRSGRRVPVASCSARA